MIKTDSYYYLDFNGISRIPGIKNIIGDSTRGIVNLVIPDNNICQNLAQYFIDKNKLSEVVIRKLEKLLIEIDHSAIDVCAAFGVLELSSNRKDLTIDKTKFDSFGKSIMSSLKLPNFNLANGFSSIFLNSTEDIDNIFPLMPMLNLFYTHTLKIKLIEQNGLSRDKAIPNIKEYLSWAEDIGLQTILPAQVAYALFGGEPKARKIVSIKKGKDPLQAVWGAAWDMMYLFIAQQYGALCDVGGTKHRLIFVTNDEACWIIGSLFKLKGVIKDDGEVSVSFGEISLDFPHFKDKIPELNNINSDIKLAQSKRVGQKRDLAQITAKINKEKKDLENQLLSIFDKQNSTVA